MRPAFQEDCNLLSAIRRGVLRREPAIDFQSARATQLDGVPDSEVLRLCAAEGRILVTHDRNSMPAHFADFLAQGQESPGVFVVNERTPIVRIIEELVIVWAASDAEEWKNRIVWIR